MGIQRFELVENEGVVDLESSKYGDYVKFDDHEKAVEAERERIKDAAIEKIQGIQ